MMKKTGMRLCGKNRGEPGSALVITLSILVLVTILVLGIMTISRTERITASSYFETRRAKSLGMMGVDNATALIRQACEAGSQTGKFWASQPGKITVFNGNGTVDAASSRFLFSTNAGGDSVNLNQAGFSGTAPIASSNSLGTNAPPSMSASWETVLQDPSAPASATNRIVGRYAYWVDDESAKLNVNTADGTAKYAASSFGPGTPTEVSLTALKSGGADIFATSAEAISTRSGARYASSASPRPFNDPSEILDANGVSADVVADNNFNITHYSRSPNLNIFGEPQIPLLTTTTSVGGAVLNAMLGAYGTLNNNTLTGLGRPLACTYPLASQLPAFTAPATAWAPAISKPLPQYFQAEHSGNAFTAASPTSSDYEMGMRIARYLKGYNSQGAAIQWPVFPGASPSGFSGKYTDRQIDSIALQIVGMLKKGTFADHYRGYAIPYIMKQGFLSGKLVRGLALAPRINEILIQITTIAGSPPMFNMKIWIETYFPKEFEGAIPAGRVNSWFYGGGAATPGKVLNMQDAPGIALANASVDPAKPSPFGGFWMDNMIKVFDQNGGSAGIDFCGNNPNVADPDPRSAAYHPLAAGKGTGPIPNAVWPILMMYKLAPNAAWNPGDYHSSCNYGVASYYPMKDGTTSISLGGGLAIRATTESSTSYGYAIDAVPLDCLRGDFTGESLADASVQTAVLDAVLPLPNITIPVPGTRWIHMHVADPLVNSFPGDWVITFDPPASEITMQQPTGNAPVSYTDGQNTIAKPAVGADPQAIWSPPQNTAKPKSNRFPSTGCLQYLRTGLMPDPANEPSDPRYVSGNKPKGTPYRALNFSPSTDASQQTVGGTSYPDWAMLDLFTTPATFQPLASPLPDAIQLTWGGATAGQINPNSAILPFDSIARRTPLESVFKGVQVSASYDAAGNPVSSSVDESALAEAIRTYVTGLGRPLMLPGEICNVPEVANFLYAGSASSKSRNDLVRQVVGNLATRSNTFSIWAIGQVIKKAAGNTDYGAFQTGDAVAGESKWNVLVERGLDFGADGVPGNSQNPGADGAVGTPDDPVDPVYHPAMAYPLRYKYRVISAREVTN